MPFPIPWITLAVACPLLGALWVCRLPDPNKARRHSLAITGLTLLLCLGGAVEFFVTAAGPLYDPWDVGARFWGERLLLIDAMNAPLLPLASLLFLLTTLSTLRSKGRLFSFTRMLVSEAILLATLGCGEPWAIIVLLALGVIPPWIELAVFRKSTRVFAVHMLLFIALLVAGQAMVGAGGAQPPAVAVLLLIGAVLIRSGAAPLHCWMTDLFEHARFGTSLLFVTPMVGAYAAIRLVLPIAPAWALHVLAVVALITAIYAAGMALVQLEVRRFFCYLFLSHSSLVLVGLGTATTMGLTGALCVWLSVGLALAGFGLTLRSIEARTGQLSLVEFHGLFEHTPRLAALFLLTGLASIGFPGTIGFVGAELLVDGAIQVHPLLGIAMVVGAALNGLAVLHAYFRVFTGRRHLASIDLRSRMPEQIAVLVFALLILGGGVYPQLGLGSRYQAAAELFELREQNGHAPAAQAVRTTGKTTGNENVSPRRIGE